MGLTQTRKITITGLNGGDIVVNDEAQIRIETTVTNTCDNPACVEGKDKKPRAITWVMEKATKDSAEIPDEAWRMIHIQGFADDKPKMYCCRQCMRDAMRDYVPPVSPREQARMDAACAAIDKPAILLPPSEGAFNAD